MHTQTLPTSANESLRNFKISCNVINHLSRKAVRSLSRRRVNAQFAPAFETFIPDTLLAKDTSLFREMGVRKHQRLVTFGHKVTRRFMNIPRRLIKSWETQTEANPNAAQDTDTCRFKSRLLNLIHKNTQQRANTITLLRTLLILSIIYHHHEL